MEDEENIEIDQFILDELLNTDDDNILLIFPIKRCYDKYIKKHNRSTQ